MSKAFQRILQLEGSCNLRDLGGYPAADGRRVRAAVLYRSGVLTYLTADDKQRIKALGVRVICDLRRARERRDEPTQWPGDDVKIVALDENPALESQGELSWRDAANGDAAREIMVNLYRNMPVWLESRLRSMFEVLAAGNVPLLFHCSAGKDRTGLAAALILHCIGVQRETILSDYALTNKAVDLEQFALKHRSARLGLSAADHPILKLPLDVRKATLGAETAYLSAALERIERDYQSIDNYLNEQFGITPDMQRRIRSLLLTP